VYDITLRRVRVAIVPIETQKCFVRVVETRVTVDNVTVLWSRNCVIPVVCVRSWEMWVVEHNCVTGCI